MDIKEVIGALGILLTFVSGGIYYVAILKRQTKPHLYTRLVFGVVECIIAYGQFVAGGGLGAWITGLTALLSIGIVLLCFKYGTKDVTLFDGATLVLALLCVIVWLLIYDPLWSVLFAAAIDALAILPTYRKTWNAPTSESLSAWMVGTTKFALSFFALTSYSLTTWLYPVEVVLVNSVLIGIILYRRKRMRTI